MTAMAQRSADGFADGNRHGWLDEMCGFIEAIALGNDAAAVLEQPGPLPPRGSVAILPVWAWAPGSRAVVGRKAVAAGGGILLLPIRVAADRHVLVLGAEDKICVSWRMAGMGCDTSGVMQVFAGPAPGGGAGAAADAGSDPGPVPAVLGAPVLRRAEIERRLKQLVLQGRAARWQALEKLDHYARTAVRNAHLALSAEIYGADSGGRILDPISLEAVADRFILGEGDRPGRVVRIIDNCLKPDAFRNADPMRVISTAMARDASQEIRLAVGDPRIGSKIRALAKSLGSTDLASIVAAYNRAYPKDRLSFRRALDALATSLLPGAAVSLTALPNIDAGAVDNGAVDNGAVENGAVENGASENGAVDTLDPDDVDRADAARRSIGPHRAA